MLSGTLTVGRPKRGEKRPDDAPSSPDDRVIILQLKGTPEYATWLDQAHRETHIPKTVIFRLAVKEWAEKRGLPVPPEL